MIAGWKGDVHDDQVDQDLNFNEWINEMKEKLKLNLFLTWNEEYHKIMFERRINESLEKRRSWWRAIG